MSYFLSTICSLKDAALKTIVLFGLFLTAYQAQAELSFFENIKSREPKMQEALLKKRISLLN